MPGCDDAPPFSPDSLLKSPRLSEGAVMKREDVEASVEQYYASLDEKVDYVTFAKFMSMQ